ncbi:MAG TPA: phosphoribosylanthranilate isomerase, partial [Thiothrix sp.]|nr:phosphoribosylanthranilate isomerase [Thiothrix sp.]
MRVKICGITSITDALTVVKFGADAIGFVFYEKSVRYVSIEQAKAICQALPPFITTVALFMNADKQQVTACLTEVHFDLLQFHGNESPGFCASFNHPYIKAVPMSGVSSLDDFKVYAEQYPDAKAFLVDSHAPNEAGGSGKVFDWKHIPVDYSAPIILAGGLNADNVTQAMQTTDEIGR